MSVDKFQVVDLDNGDGEAIGTFDTYAAAKALFDTCGARTCRIWKGPVTVVAGEAFLNWVTPMDFRDASLSRE